jgi:C4-dicarboxylate transporter, DctM subunit
MGLNLFVMSGLTGVSITAIARRAVPFVIAMLIVSIVVGFVPQLSLAFLHR